MSVESVPALLTDSEDDHVSLPHRTPTSESMESHDQGSTIKTGRPTESGALPLERGSNGASELNAMTASSSTSTEGQSFPYASNQKARKTVVKVSTRQMRGGNIAVEKSVPTRSSDEDDDDEEDDSASSSTSSVSDSDDEWAVQPRDGLWKLPLPPGFKDMPSEFDSTICTSVSSNIGPTEIVQSRGFEGRIRCHVGPKLFHALVCNGQLMSSVSYRLFMHASPTSLMDELWSMRHRVNFPFVSYSSDFPHIPQRVLLPVTIGNARAYCPFTVQSGADDVILGKDVVQYFSITNFNGNLAVPKWHFHPVMLNERIVQEGPPLFARASIMRPGGKAPDGVYTFINHPRIVTNTGEELRTEAAYQSGALIGQQAGDVFIHYHVRAEAQTRVPYGKLLGLAVPLPGVAHGARIGDVPIIMKFCYSEEHMGHLFTREQFQKGWEGEFMRTAHAQTNITAHRIVEANRIYTSTVHRADRHAFQRTKGGFFRRKNDEYITRSSYGHRVCHYLPKIDPPQIRPFPHPNLGLEYTQVSIQAFMSRSRRKRMRQTVESKKTDDEAELSRAAEEREQACRSIVEPWQ